MRVYENYVLAAELSEKAEVSRPALNQLKDARLERMGGVVVLKTDNLSAKYKTAAKKCMNLKNHVTYSYFAQEVGMHKDYMHVLEYQGRKFDRVQIGRYKLLKLSDDFVNCVKKGLTPYMIRKKEDENLAVKQINLQGFKIGFY